MNDADVTHQWARIERFRELKVELIQLRKAEEALNRISGNHSEVRTVLELTLRLNEPLHEPVRGHNGTRYIETPGITDDDIKRALLPLVEANIARLVKAIEAV